MQLFGKKLFSKRKETELYDFAQHGLVSTSSFITISDFNLSGVTSVNGDLEVTDNYIKGKKHNKKVVEKPEIKPKELYKLEALNTPTQVLNCDSGYIKKQVALLERKIKLLPKSESDNLTSNKIKYSRVELESLVVRLTNRLQYEKHRTLFEKYPYTTSETISQVVKGYKNLQTARVEEFVPDLPGEAIGAMEEYTKGVQAMCNMKPVYYIIADKKDFEEQVKKRDPVLLAQSPFGLSWQILGAWDEEMILLEEL